MAPGPGSNRSRFAWLIGFVAALAVLDVGIALIWDVSLLFVPAVFLIVLVAFALVPALLSPGAVGDVRTTEFQSLLDMYDQRRSHPPLIPILVAVTIVSLAVVLLRFLA